jgi:hypothetical protein
MEDPGLSARGSQQNAPTGTACKARCQDLGARLGLARVTFKLTHYPNGFFLLFKASDPLTPL